MPAFACLCSRRARVLVRLLLVFLPDVAPYLLRWAWFPLDSPFVCFLTRRQSRSRPPPRPLAIVLQFEPPVRPRPARVHLHALARHQLRDPLPRGCVRLLRAHHYCRFFATPLVLVHLFSLPP